MFQHLFESALVIFALACLAGAVASFFMLKVYGRAVAFALVIVAVILFAYRAGYAEASLKDRTADLMKENAALAAEVEEAKQEGLKAEAWMREAQDKANAANRRAEAAEQQSMSDQQKVRDYEEALANEPKAADRARDCRLDRNDAQRLRGIASPGKRKRGAED